MAESTHLLSEHRPGNRLNRNPDPRTYIYMRTYLCMPERGSQDLTRAYVSGLSSLRVSRTSSSRFPGRPPRQQGIASIQDARPVALAHEALASVSTIALTTGGGLSNTPTPLPPGVVVFLLYVPVLQLPYPQGEGGRGSWCDPPVMSPRSTAPDGARRGSRYYPAARSGSTCTGRMAVSSRATSVVGPSRCRRIGANQSDPRG